jgi:hypothetical protein
MTRKQIEAKAKALAVKNISKLRKEDLVRAVQKAEGHNECFHRIWDCRVQDCAWRPDCQV